MKILLVGFKLSIGNELYMNMLYKHLKENGIEVDICGDSNYVNRYRVGKGIAKGGNSKQMIIDTINPLNWIKFYSLLKKNKYYKIFYISSHPLNNIAILIAKLFKIETISHIHDPIPHSGTKYGWVILISQKTQIKLTDKVIIYGDFLKKIIIKKYNINYNKVFVIKHGVYREEKESIPLIREKQYVSLLGRIDKYKGIDIFLRAIEKLDSRISFKTKFIIGGKGDLSPYQGLIEKVKNRVIIKNYILSNEEFDEILQQSYCLVLPYKDGTQTGNIQVAYYNACPVIVSEVGSLPELVVKNKTGFLIEPNNVDDLAMKIIKLLKDDYIQLGLNGFEYYERHLKWKIVIDDLVKIFKVKI